MSSSSQSSAPPTVNPLNRRKFLTKMGIGTALSVVHSQGMADTLVNTDTIEQNDARSQLTKDDLPLSLVDNKPLSESKGLQSRCMTPNIETRLFASSNVGSNHSRNQLALERLACAGFKVQNPTITERQYLRFAGTDAQRVSDLQNLATGAIAMPKLLMAVRGGYGAMRLLPAVDWLTLGRIMAERGTILTGFSDVTAIQCALLAQGKMSSLAAPMLYSEFGKANPDKVSCQQFVEALINPNLSIEVQNANLTSKQLPTILASSSEQAQTLNGTIWGGNLSVVSALAGSKYLPRIDGGIVFLEDVGEQPYRVERMLYDLYLAEVFKNQQAIVFGAISATGEDGYDARYDVATVIRQLHKLTGLPIYNGMSFGHINQKHSFPLGAQCEITPNTIGGYQLTFANYPTIEAHTIHAEGLW